MKLPTALLSLLLLPLSTQAATIAITSTCQGPGIAPATGSPSCSTYAFPPGGYAPGAFASSSVALSIAANPANYNLFSTQSSVNAVGTYSDSTETRWLAATARTITSFSDTLVTTGPSRSGFIQVSVFGNATYSAGTEVGGGVLTLPNTAAGYSLSDSCSLYNCPSSPFIAFNTFSMELGVPFPVQYSADLFSDSTDALDGPSSAMIQLTYGFRFLEADGITPVSATETPEPSTVFLGGAGLLLFLGHKRFKSI